MTELSLCNAPESMTRTGSRRTISPPSFNVIRVVLWAAAVTLLAVATWQESVYLATGSLQVVAVAVAGEVRHSMRRQMSLARTIAGLGRQPETMRPLRRVR